MKTAAPPNSLRPPRKLNKRNRLSRFVFTLNNYTQDELTSVKEYPCLWLVVALENAKSGTPHLQGACVIGKQIAFSTLKKYPGFMRAHVETMKGKPSDSLAYCSKEDGNPFVKGSMPNPGKRNDIACVVAKLRAGKSLPALIKEDEDEGTMSCLVRYCKGFQYISSVLTPPRSSPPIVIWIHGTTGTNKTRCAVQLGADLGGVDGLWLSSGSLRWFDGYYGQQVAVFDDLRTKHARFWELLRLLDRYPHRVEIKGSSVQWSPRYIIITAPKSPSEMWNLRTEEDIQQLVRRVTHTVDSTTFDNYEHMLRYLHTKIYESQTPEVPRETIDLEKTMSLTSTEEFSDSVDEALDDARNLDNLANLYAHADAAFKL